VNAPVQDVGLNISYVRVRKCGRQVWPSNFGMRRVLPFRERLVRTLSMLTRDVLRIRFPRSISVPLHGWVGI
jgi:hypothetical protein